MQQLKSMKHAQKFCSAFSSVCNQFRVEWHALGAASYRELLRGWFDGRNDIAETRVFAAAS
jgi:hypothetical protein